MNDDGFISRPTSINNSEQKKTNREKYVVYCSVLQIHINPEKTHDNDCLNLPNLTCLYSDIINLIKTAGALTVLTFYRPY